MVSLESLQATPNFAELPNSSPARISFSSEFLDENNFISICPTPRGERESSGEERERASRNAEFEFLSGNNNSSTTTNNNMITADELFSEGKLLPFWQMHHSEKLNKISLKSEIINNNDEKGLDIGNDEQSNKEDHSRTNTWFLDDDPSPRPPKCTVLWKELLRLKKQRASSTLSPSSSSSSSSSSLGDVASTDERKEGLRSNKEKPAAKRIKKATSIIRIRPMINVPVCTQVKNSALPPLFPSRKCRIER